MAGKIAHTEAPTASQGMKQYLTTCATSGLPHIRAIAEEYAELSGPARMRRYLADFGEHFERNEGVQVVEKRPASKSLLERLGLGKVGVEVVSDDDEPVEKPVRKRRNSRRNAAAKFEAGTKFEYASTSGTVVLWTIKSVNRKGIATASNGKRESTFRVSTLTKLNGSVVKIVA